MSEALKIPSRAGDILLDVPGEYVSPGWRDYAMLVKLRLTSLVMASVATGFWMTSAARRSAALFWPLLFGAFLVIGGANAWNEIIERDTDAKMKRTAVRPLPCGRMQISHARWVATSMAVVGISALALFVNPLTALLGAAGFALYVFAYTPMKRISPWCVAVGAFPGAIPALMGAAAAENRITPLGLVLFGIVLLWQFPHFCSIAWLARDDYGSAGLKMVFFPETGRFTAYQILLGSCGLFAVSPLLSVLKFAGTYYLIGSYALGILMLSCACGFWLNHNRRNAREMMGIALLYLPLLYLLMLLDKVALPWQ